MRFEHRLRVVEELLRLRADLVVLEDRRIAPGQLPGLEERRPVDVGDQLGEAVVGKRARAEERRLRRLVAVPVDLEAVGARRRERDAALGGLVAQVRLAHLGVLGADLADVGLALALGQELRHDADGAAGVEHVDRLPLRVVGRDLDRRVHAARRRAADQQRAVEAFALHLGGDEAHLVERRRDEAREPDDVGLLALGGLEDLRRRHHDAEIDHLVVVALEHDADDVLADVVHVALDGRHDDLAGGGLRLEARGLLLRLEVGLQVGDRLLHHARRLHDLRQEHLAGAEQVADDVHAGHQRALDDVQRLRQPPGAPPRCRPR